MNVTIGYRGKHYSKVLKCWMISLYNCTDNNHVINYTIRLVHLPCYHTPSQYTHTQVSHTGGVQHTKQIVNIEDTVIQLAKL